MSGATTGGLYGAVRASLLEGPDRVRIEAESRALTGGQIAEAAERWAAALAALGVTKGDRVAVQAEKSPEILFLYLACLRLGAAYLPLNTAYRRAEIAYFLGDSEPRLFVCDPANAAEHTLAAREHGAELRTLAADGTGTLADAVAFGHPAAPEVEIADSDLAAILYTSGTTGRSKGAMISHANLLSNARSLIQLWGMGAGDVLVHALPIFHIHGLFVALNTSLLAGVRVIWQAKFDPDAVLAALPRATLFMGVPTFYTRLLADPRLDETATVNMRLFVSGSAPLLEETFREFQARTGHTILERYGMTEAGMICSNPLDGERRPGTVGQPLPGVEVRLGDPQEGVGVLEVRGQNVFGGYWRMPEKTHQEFRSDGFFITGDMSTISDDGYVSIVGRSKDLIICGGLNVYPKEIETLLDGLEGVAESAVIGVPHPDFGEAVVAAIRPVPGTKVTPADIVRQAKQDLAGFKAPKLVFFVDELPRNTMGKVQKNLLRDRYKDSFQPAQKAG